MKRRKAIGLLGCAAAVWPIAGISQPATLPVVGYVGMGSLAGGRLALVPKSVELVRELLPSEKLIAELVNPTNPNPESHLQDLRATARAVALRMLILEARDASDFHAAFATLVQQRAGALLVTSDAIFNSNIRALVDLAARNAVPTVYPWRDFVDGGGLLSYGNSLNDSIRQIGV